MLNRKLDVYVCSLGKSWCWRCEFWSYKYIGVVLNYGRGGGGGVVYYESIGWEEEVSDLCLGEGF